MSHEARKAIKTYRMKALRAAELATELEEGMRKGKSDYGTSEDLGALGRMARELGGLVEEARDTIRREDNDKRQLGLVLEAEAQAADEVIP